MVFVYYVNALFLTVVGTVFGRAHRDRSMTYMDIEPNVRARVKRHGISLRSTAQR